MSRHTAPELGSYAGGITSIVASMTLTEWGVIIGIATAILTFVLNAVYMYRKDKREQEESRATIDSLKDRDGRDE